MWLGGANVSVPLRRVRSKLSLVALAAATVFSAPSRSADAGSLAEGWRWRIFDREEGLSSSPISAIYQDREDFVYAAAADAVYRYDLHRWEEIPAPETFGGAAAVRFVESMNVTYCVTQRAMWVVERGGVLRLFHPPSNVGSERIHVAAGVLDDVYLIDAGSRSHLQLRGHRLEVVDSGVTVPDGRIRDYTIDAQGLHWLATSLGLYYRDLGERRWRELRDRDLDVPLEEPECVRFFSAQLRREPLARGSRGARRGTEHIEHWALFRSRTDPEETSLARLVDKLWEALPGAIDGPPVDGLVADLDGTYYVTCEDGRVFHRGPDDGAWTLAEELGAGSVRLHGGLLDSTGNLWFRLGAGGVAFVDVESRRWERFGAIPGRPFPRVLSLLESSQGEIWAGTASGVFRYTRREPTEGGEASRLPEVYDAVLGTPLKEITGLAEDRQGNVWIGSADEDAFRGGLYFDHPAGAWVQAEFCEWPIRRIVADSMHELWFLPDLPGGVGREEQAVLYRRSTYTGDVFRRVDVDAAGVFDLVRTRGDVFWLATRDGLLRAVLEGDTLRVERRFGEKDGLATPRLWAVAEGPGGAIWTSYQNFEGGVTRVDGERLERFDLAEGLSSPAVFSILAVSSNLWFGTDRGLMRFDGECWYHLPVTSPASRSWVLPLVAPRDSGRESELIIGTLAQGVLRYRMDDRRRPRFTKAELPAEADTEGSIRFSWDARDYKNQTRPEDLLFRHRVDGGDWSSFSSERVVSFAGLAPGEHSFEIEVRDLDGNRNREELVHRFTVGVIASPVPWTLVVGGLAALVAALVGLGLQRHLRDRRRLLDQYADVFRSYPAPVFLLDREGRVVEYNGVSPHLVGLEGVDSADDDLVGRPFQLLAPFAAGALPDLIQGALRGEAGSLRISRGGSGGGVGSILDVLAFPMGPRGAGAVVVAEDRTREVEEERLRERNRRLEGLRRLAERFRRELEGILAEMREKVGSRGSEGEADSRALERAGRLSAALATFSSVGETDGSTGEVDVGQLVEAVLEGGGRRAVHLSPRVRVDLRVQAGVWAVRAQEAVLREALERVLQNAAEALVGGGKLRVRVRNLRLGAPSGELAAGSYVELTLEDDGPGIGPLELDRVFDPFFSTKPRDEAEGLGLSLALGKIRSQGGDIRLDSRPGEGTAIRLLLPACR